VQHAASIDGLGVRACSALLEDQLCRLIPLCEEANLLGAELQARRPLRPCWRPVLTEI
jgi:hypothetical protein